MGDQENGLDISALHLSWDSQVEMRNRLRDGQAFMFANDLKVDNPTCIMNALILKPILLRMSCSPDRKLPSVRDLRFEMQQCYELNKRSPANPEDAKEIVADSWQLRKLLSHVKAKVRREEVSNDT